MIKILAGTSALPVPGGGSLASVVNATINIKKPKIEAVILMATLLVIIFLLLWQISQNSADDVEIE
jgi:hypothetical protein